MRACCSPGRDDEPAPEDQPGLVAAGSDEGSERVVLGGEIFLMGTDDGIGHPADGEGPARAVEVDRFAIDIHAVSNERFARFAEATGHRTDAERFGWSFVFVGLLAPDDVERRSVAEAPWWKQVLGADWRHPEGPGTDLQGRENHPVVHVSWRDAKRYAKWAGGRLPREAEWEYAARGGLVQKRYAWGDEFAPDGQTMCNIFEGEFPHHNTGADGYLGTAPVDAFPPNGYGLHNVAGNVWEWCSDAFTRPGASPSLDLASPTRVVRGGSYLCHDSYCDRYRVAARTASTIDSTTGNTGFRMAWTIE